jgi:N-acylneuraminate cytidylyltransferase
LRQTVAGLEYLAARQTAAVDRVYVSSMIRDFGRGDPLWGVTYSETGRAGDGCRLVGGGLLHAVAVIAQREGRDPARIVFLQATSPLREPDDIDGAVGKLFPNGPMPSFPLRFSMTSASGRGEKDGYRGLTFDPAHRGRRQDREPLFWENGSIYVFRPEILRTFNNRIGGVTTIYEMPFWKSYEIDTKDHIEICEYYFRKYL